MTEYGIKSMLKPPALQNPGVYSVPCSCGSSYTGETKRAISTRLQEHIKGIQKNEVTKSAIFEHLAYNEDHFIRFDQAKSNSRERFYVPRLVREAIEIKMHSNFNRDQSFNLSSAGDPLISKLKLNKIEAKNNNKHTNQNNLPADVISFACSQEYIDSQQQQSMQHQQQVSSQLQAQTHPYNLRTRTKQ